MAGKKISLADWQSQLGKTNVQSDKIPEPGSDSQLVYSTASGKISQSAENKPTATAYPDGAVRIRRETKGRGGKAVLTISGIDRPFDELTKIAATLKKKCACGGAIKDGIIEIQGDKRDLVAQTLQQLGFTTKWAGG